MEWSPLQSRRDYDLGEDTGQDLGKGISQGRGRDPIPEDVLSNPNKPDST